MHERGLFASFGASASRALRQFFVTRRVCHAVSLDTQKHRVRVRFSTLYRRPRVRAPIVRPLLRELHKREKSHMRSRLVLRR